jgi:hypothetical protein
MITQEETKYLLFVKKFWMQRQEFFVPDFMFKNSVRIFLKIIPDRF